MTATELKNKYTALYEYMAVSNEPKYMKLFGEVMNEMMYWMIENKTEAAQELISKLCAIKWHNYLTQKEADAVVASMKPQAPWNRSVWVNAMDSFSLVKEEEPYYNSCALFATMNMIYSDSSETIAKIMGKSLSDVPAEHMVKAVYALAIDKLKDKDKVFSIRS